MNNQTTLSDWLDEEESHDEIEELDFDHEDEATNEARLERLYSGDDDGSAFEAAARRAQDRLREEHK